MPPCEEVEAGTLCEDEGEASTPICDEQEILTEDNRCVTQKIPITPIYPDDGSEGVLEVCPPRCGNNEDIPTPELDIDGGDNETIDPEVVIDPEPVQEEEIPEVDEEFNVEEPTMEEESSEDVEDVEEELRISLALSTTIEFRTGINEPYSNIDISEKSVLGVC